MAESLYLPYLLMLLLVPVLLRWRWGLIAALGVTVAELGLVILVFYLMASYHLLPDLHVGEPPPAAEHPFAKIRRGQAEGYAQFFIFGVGPAMATLVGGAVAVVWSVVPAVWRLINNREPQ